MKRNDVLAYGILALAAVALIFSFTGFGFLKSEDGGKAAESGFKAIETGTTDQNDVSISLTPKGFVDGKLSVEISANTHSVDLSQFDLKKITTLEFEDKIVNPIQAPTLSGHHASGTLVFDVGKEIKAFTITIKEVPAVEDRVFSWN